MQPPRRPARLPYRCAHAASGAQFSLLPPDNATGNFTKVVQRIPVKLRLDPGNALAGKLRPGMSVTATILTDSKPK